MISQSDLFSSDPGPPGFLYRPDILTPGEADDLSTWIAGLPLEPFAFRGFQGARRVMSFGWRYDFSTGRLLPARPLSTPLLDLRRKVADVDGMADDDLVQALVTEYAPGAPIGWHRDRPEFDRVVGVSLESSCILRFRRRTDDGWTRVARRLEPGSSYLLAGEARTTWEHSITPAVALRRSVTFRSLRG